MRLLVVPVSAWWWVRVRFDVVEVGGGLAVVDFVPGGCGEDVDGVQPVLCCAREREGWVGHAEEADELWLGVIILPARLFVLAEMVDEGDRLVVLCKHGDQVLVGVEGGNCILGWICLG